MKKMVAKKRVGKEGRIKQKRERVGNLCKLEIVAQKTSKNTALTIKGDNNPIQSKACKTGFQKGFKTRIRKSRVKG